MKPALIHTIRIHTGTDEQGNGLVTVVHGTDKRTVYAEAKAIPHATLYEIEEWYSERRCKSRRTVTSLEA